MIEMANDLEDRKIKSLKILLENGVLLVVIDFVTITHEFIKKRIKGQ